MIITFTGHADFIGTKNLEEKILAFLEEVVGDNSADMYLGGYGGFDEFSLECCKKYKESHRNLSLVLVTPYMTIEYQKNHLEYAKTMYDSIIHPEIEDKPKRFAIVYRNKYMVEMADYIVAYVSHGWGGAYSTYNYARRKGKTIINLANFDQ